jgi:hypothetical protein
METVGPSEMSMNVHRITWRHIQEDNTLHNYWSDILEFNTFQEICISKPLFSDSPPVSVFTNVLADAYGIIHAFL